ARHRPLQPGHPRRRVALRRGPGRLRSRHRRAGGRRHHGADRAGAPEHPRHSPGGRSGSLQRRQDDRVSRRHGRLRRDEHRIRPRLRRAPARPIHGGRRGAAARRARRDRRGGGITFLSQGSGSGLVVWPVFKTATEAPPVAPVGSIPTRSRHPFAPLSLRDRFYVTLRLGRWLAGLVLLVALGAAVPTSQVAAQDTTAVTVPADTTPAAVVVEPKRLDSLALRTRPMNAFLRSFLLPGWGQAKLGRKLTAGIL